VLPSHRHGCRPGSPGWASLVGGTHGGLHGVMEWVTSSGISWCFCQLQSAGATRNPPTAWRWKCLGLSKLLWSLHVSDLFLPAWGPAAFPESPPHHPRIPWQLPSTSAASQSDGKDRAETTPGMWWGAKLTVVRRNHE